jgi:protein-S-isoprenylcysteine O-methyltransferase Ste14
MEIYARVIAACWIAFAVVWIVASIVARSGNRPYSPQRIVLRVLIVAALVLGVRYGDRLPAPTFGRLTAGVAADVAAAGSVLCVIGVAFAIWARVTLGRNWGMPMTRHDTPELVTSGPYTYVRHPIYTGLLTMWIGTSLVYPLTAAATVIMIAYCLFSARREEQDMQRQFPETYPAYKKRSKMLVPFLL